MRKSVLFLIGIVFIVSIVVVTFFGMKISFDQFKIYINEIEITNFDREIRGNKYKTVYFNETEGFTTIFIEYKIGPVDASDPDAISFTLSNHTYEDENGETQYYAEISSSGELVFYKPKAVTVTVTATDGSGEFDTMLVTCKQGS